MTGRFTTILWDVDGTLLDFAYSQRYALGKCFCTIGREMAEEELALYAQINDWYWGRLERGEISREELLTGRFTALFDRLGIEGVDVEAFRREYQEGLGSVYRYLDDSLAVCRRLQGRVKQYVITNGVASTQRRKLALSGLGDVMDGIFISEETGYPKPEREFFARCLEQVEEKDGGRILVVGDSLSSDIRGGVQAGLSTCWYNRDGRAWSGDWKPDYEIRDLHGIFEILEGTAR